VWSARLKEKEERLYIMESEHNKKENELAEVKKNLNAANGEWEKRMQSKEEQIAAEKNKIFEKAERWFNKKSPQGQLEAIYDAYIVHLVRVKNLRNLKFKRTLSE
jgi:hypothetical protein